MSLFEDMMPIVNAGVETYLGDSLIYTRKGETDPIEDCVGFVSNNVDEDATDGIDWIRARWILKINKRFLPDGPNRGDRLTCAKLQGVTYQPQSHTPVDAGDSWLFGIQKV